MEKNLFWKICSVVFLVLLALLVWSQFIYVDSYEGRVVKVNKLTGESTVTSAGN